MTALVAVAHGTRAAQGPLAVRRLLDRARGLRPALEIRESYAELAHPLLEEALAAKGSGGFREASGLREGRDAVPCVAVPLMLARGFHALIDIPGRVPAGTLVSRPLGPDPLLAEALVDRLGEGCQYEAVVLGAAGSSDPAGLADVRTAARLLACRLGRPVRTGFVTGEADRLPDVVDQARRISGGRVAVASYLLAPGFFHDRVATCGADLISPPLGAHEAVARLILRRYDQALKQALKPALATAG